MTRRWLLALLGGVIAAGLSTSCSGEDDCAAGTASCPCYGNGTCNPGLLCAGGVCQGSGTPLPPTDCAAGRAVSENCCLDLGIDACGAGLVCAALDGRTVPTCYLERSRLGNQTCTVDTLCASGDCHEQSGTCVPMYAEDCTEEVGCSAGVPPTGTVLCAADLRNGYELDPAKSTCTNWSAAMGYNCGVCRTVADCDPISTGEVTCQRHRCVLPNTTCG